MHIVLRHNLLSVTDLMAIKMLGILQAWTLRLLWLNYTRSDKTNYDQCFIIKYKQIQYCLYTGFSYLVVKSGLKSIQYKIDTEHTDV